MSRDFKAHAPQEAEKQVPVKGGFAADREKVVDPALGQGAEDDPTRFGDWSVGGRCVDF